MLLTVNDVSKKAIKLDPKQTLYDARNIMLRYNISRIVVAQGDKVVGIITEKDIARFLYKQLAQKRLDEVRIDEVMSKNLITVDQESSFNNAAKLMLDNGISSLIVVDKQGILKGILTKSDLVRVYFRYYAGRHRVEDYMTKSVFTVVPDDTSLVALSIITNNKVSRVVVMKNKKPLGILTLGDLLQAAPYFAQHIYSVGKPESPTLMIHSGMRNVFLIKDLIRSEPITVLKDSDLAEAAEIMTNNAISGLPVVDTNFILVGIVTKSDVVKALAAEDYQCYEE